MAGRRRGGERDSPPLAHPHARRPQRHLHRNLGLVGLSLTPGCQIGYVDNTGCHQLVFFTMRPTGLSLPGVTRLRTWTILGVINWCFRLKCQPYAVLDTAAPGGVRPRCDEAEQGAGGRRQAAVARGGPGVLRPPAALRRRAQHVRRRAARHRRLLRRALGRGRAPTRCPLFFPPSFLQSSGYRRGVGRKGKGEGGATCGIGETTREICCIH
jgi:hypothetical protein